ncbi:MAG: hypothetical protein QW797_02070 [Thermoproteota archaeon]
MVANVNWREGEWGEYVMFLRSHGSRYAMPELQCLACNRVISEEEMSEFRGDVRCPYCGFRVLKKTRSKKIAKQVIPE